MEGEVIEDREREARVQVIPEMHFVPGLQQEQSIFYNMQFNHQPGPYRRRLCLENLPGMYSMSCTQLLALADSVVTSSSVGASSSSLRSQFPMDPWIDSWNMEPNPWILNSGSSIGIDIGIAEETTMEKPQYLVSTPQKFLYDLNLAPEEMVGTTQPTEPEFSPITLDTPGKRLHETDQELHDSIEKSLLETGSPAREKKGKRARDDDKFQLKTPQQTYKRKKIRPKVVREGKTNRPSSESGVKKSSAATTTTKTYERRRSVRPKRSSRRSLRFDDDFQEDNEYCGISFSSEGHIGVSSAGKELTDTEVRIFGNIPKKRRQSRTNGIIRKEGIYLPPEPGNDCFSSMLSLVNTGPVTFFEPEENISSTSHISQCLGGIYNQKKLRRKRSSTGSRPRNFRSYEVPRSFPQRKDIVSKMQSTVFWKKRSRRDPIASQLNARVLHMQWRRQNSTGTSPAELWEQRFSVDAITKLFTELDINRERSYLLQSKETALILHKNALVPYKEDGSIVPYSSEKKHQPKVTLDAETTRVWKLLMVSIDSEGIDGSDENKKKWWEEERSVFHGRANSFITRMRLVQGDRRFSPWKGSVVDSVVGVFLTQNVADHSSSSAFMDLAAEFPINLNFNKESYYEEWESSVTHETIMKLDLGNVVATPRIRNPTRIIIHEVDDDDDNTSAVCSYCEIDLNQEPLEELASTLEAQEEKSTRMEKHINVDVKIMKKPVGPPAKPKEITKSKKKETTKNKPKESFDWDSLRRQAESGGQNTERTERTMDTVDWDALRCTNVHKIADIIRKRGMNNMLSERIKAFLNRIYQEHGSIDLEWLRDIPPDKAKEYLLSINGLGLKSVECVRLLSLHQIAFPVDTNVGRIAVRLGWVPLQPLPDELQMHLLELYPVLESVQKYLWPRLCKLDQKTLYELHYHMITFGKVFCTKVKPNCNACPLKAECRHYSSARASARLALPEPEQRTTVIAHERRYKPKSVVVNFRQSLFLSQEGGQKALVSQNCEPIIEEPASPEPEFAVHDIEDYPWDNNGVISTISEDSTSNDPWDNKDVIPTIMLNKEAGTSTDLVVVSTHAASIPRRKLKTKEKLRTEHHVYELPDFHPILEGFEKRETEDMVPYLLAIWTPGETSNSIQPPEQRCVSQKSNTLCHDEQCFFCNNIREEKSQIVRGTILIPCRTAMRGGFPLNGTYFQTNEVFADHGSSINPIDVPRQWIWNLRRRITYFGSSISAIFGGLSVDAIQYSFWRGYVCVRGFDRETRKPQSLVKRLHCPPSKQNQEDKE